jgi:hypothetical protein
MASQTFFEATENGTKMTDVVHYALPWAFRKDNEQVVKSKLEEIFHIEFLGERNFNSK